MKNKLNKKQKYGLLAIFSLMITVGSEIVLLNILDGNVLGIAMMVLFGSSLIITAVCGSKFHEIIDDEEEPEEKAQQ